MAAVKRRSARGVSTSSFISGARESMLPLETVKVVVVGDGAVGKTSLLVSFTAEKFLTEHTPTVFANYAKTITVSEERVHLWLCDTAGQEEYDRLRVSSYADTQVFLVCFSVTDPDSLHNATEKWLPEVRFYTPLAQIILVATKSDLRNDESEESRLRKDGKKIISVEQGEQLAKDQGADGYLECSALTRDGLEEVFDLAARLALAPNTKAEAAQGKRFPFASNLMKRCCFL